MIMVEDMETEIAEAATAEVVVEATAAEAAATKGRLPPTLLLQPFPRTTLFPAMRS
ncbi:hypothetical protein [Paenibacillus sp. MY03]|uniref:hypothetical protein n=1 Tax=Paenibacillus sp. MY03 TaxID=302980 RepID=UPI0015C67643|nr:hypothetical protein [Paenibacillus sp. MY03]